MLKKQLNIIKWNITFIKKIFTNINIKYSFDQQKADKTGDKSDNIPDFM